MELLTTLINKLFADKNIEKKFELDQLAKVLPNEKLKEDINILLENNVVKYSEVYKNKNINGIAELADKHIQKINDYKKKVNDYKNDNKNREFIIRFIDAAGKCGNEYVQGLWAKILVGEINKPNTISYKALDTISSFSEREARMFNDIIPYILKTKQFDKLFLIYENVIVGGLIDGLIKRKNLELLIEYGLFESKITNSSMINYTSNENKEEDIFELENYAHKILFKCKNEAKIKNIGIMCLTNISSEIYSAVAPISEKNMNYELSENYLTKILMQLFNSNIEIIKSNSKIIH